MRPIPARNPSSQFVTATTEPIVLPAPAPAAVLDQPAVTPAAAPDIRREKSSLAPVDAAPEQTRPAASAMPMPQAPAGRAFGHEDLDPFTLELVSAAPVVALDPQPQPAAAAALTPRPARAGDRTPLLVALGAACLTGVAGLLAVTLGGRARKPARPAALSLPVAAPIPFTRPAEIYKDVSAW